MEATLDAHETFEPNRGFRLHFQGKSILLHSSAFAQPLSGRQRAAFARPLCEFIASVGGYAPAARGAAREIRLANFPDAAGPAFKIVAPEAEEFLRAGSFRLGSPTYYAALGADPRADTWEGYSIAFLRDGQREFICAATTGFNCLTFCSSRARDHSRVEALRQKFAGPGGRVVRIRDLQALAGLLGEKVGAARWSVRDVRYATFKYASAETATYRRLPEIMGTGDLSLEALHELNKAFAPSLYEDLLLGSLFTKPAQYAGESERRIVLEMAADVTPPYYLDVSVPEAVSLLEFED